MAADIATKSTKSGTAAKAKDAVRKQTVMEAEAASTLEVLAEKRNDMVKQRTELEGVTIPTLQLQLRQAVRQCCVSASVGYSCVYVRLCL
jgi:hypothetical protein